MRISLKKNLISYKVVFCLVPILLLTSCSEIGLLSEKNSWIVNNIDSFSDFFKVFIVLQISILLISLILGLAFGRGGNVISLLVHFIWIVSERDYGFFKVLLLFGLFTIVSKLTMLLVEFLKERNRENKH